MDIVEAVGTGGKKCTRFLGDMRRMLRVLLSATELPATKRKLSSYIQDRAWAVYLQWVSAVGVESIQRAVEKSRHSLSSRAASAWPERMRMR